MPSAMTVCSSSSSRASTARFEGGVGAGVPAGDRLVAALPEGREGVVARPEAEDLGLGEAEVADAQVGGGVEPAAQRQCLGVGEQAGGVAGVPGGARR